MTIASEVQRIKTNIANAYDKCEEKGATMPDNENSANLADTIDSIPAGGGGEVRGGWTVPAQYLAIDAETNSETSSEYLIAKEYAGNNYDVYVVGFTVHKGYLTFKWTPPSSVTSAESLKVDYPCIIKISDGRIFYASYLGQEAHSYSSQQIISVNNSAGDICIYFYYIGKKESVGGGLSGFWSSGSSGNWSKGTYSDITLARFIRYFAVKGNVAGGYPYSGNLARNNAESFKLLSPITGKVTIRASDLFDANSGGVPLHKYLPPILEWCSSAEITGITSNVFANPKGTPCVPDGADLSSYTDTGNPLYIGYSNGCEDDLFVNREIRLYCTLPATDVTFRRFAVLSKDNWEYIASHAPSVSGCTLKVTQENIDAMGGTTSIAYTTLTEKGWTITA